MKKLVTALALMLCLALPAAAMTPGTYEAAGIGNNGEIRVAVTVNETEITDITVLDHKETAGIGDNAIAELVPEILSAQSLGVDHVSGATNSSKGLMDAIAQCIALAGGDAEAMKAVPVEKKAGEAIEKSADVIVVGAGGAGRAMCCVLAYEGAKKIYVASRTLASAQNLADDLNANFAPVAEAMTMADYKDVLSKCDCVMNSSGVGMGKSIGQNPMKKEDIDTNALYYDACYNPAKTQFLIDAEEAGAKILNGLGMSLYQGARQIKLWTGIDPDIEVMRQELFDILAGKPEKE